MCSTPWFALGLCGLAFSGRPCWVLILPIFWKDLGWKRLGIILSVTAVSMGISWFLGWTPAHLVRRWTHPTMAAMLVGSFFGAFAESRSDRWLIAGMLLMLPGLWATSEAYHVLLGLPFIVEGLDQRGGDTDGVQE